MAKKTTEAAAQDVIGSVEAEAPEYAASAAAEAAPEPAEAAPERIGSGFYCYIGPNLKKLIQTGTVYRGTREEALARAAEAIAAQPLVKNLIVSGGALPGALIKVRTPGNALYESYWALAGKDGK